mgnify:CR=1 FL=1
MPTTKEVRKALEDMPAKEQRLKRQNFDLSTGVSGARKKIASYHVETPLAFREESVRLVFTTVEQFQTPGDGSQTTYDLAHDALPTNNTTDFVLYEGGSRVEADTVDYAGNSFTYTGPGSQEYLHAYYVPRDPVEVEIVKTAPKSQGRVEETVFDATTSMLHERNQHKEPPEIDFSAGNPLDPMVPRKWTIDIYAEGSVPFAWDDSGEANGQNTVATNAVVSIPINRATQDLPDLSQAVKTDIIAPKQG